MLGRLNDISFDFEGKSSHISVVDSPASHDVFFDVLTFRANDEVELGFRVERFD